MVATKHAKLWVYDFVSYYYKPLMQRWIYLNVVYPMETHDSARVDDAMTIIADRGELDGNRSQKVLPPDNPYSFRVGVVLGLSLRGKVLS